MVTQTVVATAPEFTLLPPPGSLLWECSNEPGLGWVIIAIDTRVQEVKFALSLSRHHQNQAAAKEVCEALARVYNTT